VGWVEVMCAGDVGDCRLLLLLFSEEREREAYVACLMVVRTHSYLLVMSKYKNGVVEREMILSTLNYCE
jgi:hypothetical protein